MSLFRQNLQALSAYQGQQTLYRRHGHASARRQRRRQRDVGGHHARASCSRRFSSYSASPGNATTAENAVEAARQLARTLNNGTDAIQSFRSDTDRQIGDAVNDLNNLLADFKKANDEVVSGTKLGRDVNEALDQRDALLKKIAALVPVNVVKRDNNDMMLTTADGTTLFETVPRTVTFQPTAAYGAATQGNQVMIDGVPLSAGSGGNTSGSGTIAAMVQLRDVVAPQMQAQLDEIARGLITAFRETDPSGVQPDAAGLFTWSGGPAIPAAGTLSAGLAGTINVNPAMDSTVGGDPDAAARRRRQRRGLCVQHHRRRFLYRPAARLCRTGWTSRSPSIPHRASARQ